MAWLSEELERQEARIATLRQRYEQLTRRTTPSEGDTVLDRLEGAVKRRRARFNAIASQIDDLSRQRDAIESEVMRCLQGIEALLANLVEDLEAANGPCWSPTPVVGFTNFMAIGDHMHDGDHLWHGAVLHSECHRRTSDPLPHQTDQCIREGCGIHAFKSFHSLPAPAGSGLHAIAQVALKGRVVEHQSGYRGETGEVTALIAFDDSRWMKTHSPCELARLMEMPMVAFEESSSPIPPSTMMYLEADAFLVTR